MSNNNKYNPCCESVLAKVTYVDILVLQLQILQIFVHLQNKDLRGNAVFIT